MGELVANLLRVKKDSDTTLESFVMQDDILGTEIFDEKSFLRTLCLERKRTERSSRRFVLMLLEAGNLLKNQRGGKPLDKVLRALCSSTRETDAKGWYKDGSVIGVIFTEIGETDGKIVANALMTRLTKALCGVLSIEEINEVHMSFHIYPEDSGTSGSIGPMDMSLYPDSEENNGAGSRALKRSVDIIGGLSAIVLFSPILMAIALAIKLTSKGPMLFRQERVGQFGQKFTFLKFRSMYTGNDPRAHQDYMKSLISGQTNETSGVYKIKNDPRVTAVGRFLRRTSLDELPQFFNVLAGDMSLVGPRPPIPYEFDLYFLWQRRRLLSVKPGITGLWQVGGRSRVKFDEMVRMDLEYARTWSVLLDLKILLLTPKAMISGDGAY